jgi:hypothetical protein
MKNPNLFDALEECLQALDEGADVESCLARFPSLVEDLRPILTAAVQAHSAAVLDVPEEATRRGKARLMQAAADMRARRNSVAAPAKFRLKLPEFQLFSPRFARLALTTFVMMVFLLSSGTGLVNAASSALPGDSLYTVKRSWEDVRLFLVINPDSRQQLATQFEEERVMEIEELYSEKRVVRVDFQGVVENQNGKEWTVSGLKIELGDNVQVDETVQVGSTVQVIGETDDGVIKADQIVLVALPGVTPTVPPSGRTPQPANIGDDGNGETPTPHDAGNYNDEENGNGNLNTDNINDNHNDNDNDNDNDNSNSNENININDNSNSNKNDNSNTNDNTNSNKNDNSNTNDNSNSNTNDNSNSNKNDNTNSNNNNNTNNNTNTNTNDNTNTNNDNTNTNTNTNDNTNTNTNDNSNKNDNTNTNTNDNTNTDDNKNG